MGKLISPNKKEIEKLLTPLTEGEKKILNIFKEKTSDECEIYVQPHLNGSRPDFILLNPKTGIAVFEVKDWTKETLQFIVKKQKKNPIADVYNYVKKIHDLYCPRLYEESLKSVKKIGYAAISAGLIFTNISQKDLDQLMGNSELYSWIKNPPYQTLSGKETVEKNYIEKIFPHYNLKTSQIMKPEYADDLRNWLIEPDYSKEQRNKIILDWHQRQIVKSRTESGYRKIAGSSGSGKSLVLVERANKILSENENKKILFVNFNITLCNMLKDLCNRQRIDSRKIFFTHFHDWLNESLSLLSLLSKKKEIVKDYFDNENDDEAVEHYTPQLCGLISNCANTEPIKKYDAIFVDEGQDFELLWWNCLRKSLKENGEMLLAADLNQNIYNKGGWTEKPMKGSGLPGTWSERLKVSYRLPENVIPFVNQFMKFCGDFNNNFFPVKQPAKQQSFFEKCKIKWIQTNNVNIENKCFDELMNIIKEDKKSDRSFTDLTFVTDNENIGLKIKDILKNKKIECMDTYNDQKFRNKITNYKLTKFKKTFFYKGSPRIKLTTLHSFKGWEGRLIIVNINKSDNKHIYTALTRIKSHPDGSFLTIVSTKAELREFAENYEILIRDKKYYEYFSI